MLVVAEIVMSKNNANVFGYIWFNNHKKIDNLPLPDNVVGRKPTIKEPHRRMHNKFIYLVLMYSCTLSLNSNISERAFGLQVPLCRLIFYFDQSSFIVIHKVANVPIFVVLKFEHKLDLHADICVGPHKGWRHYSYRCVRKFLTHLINLSSKNLRLAYCSHC